jgi:predicted DNA-binding transcriptional regulator YafY
MVETTARLLSVLSVLQVGRAVSGPELAVRLGVDVRTIRRDIDRLRQLGYAVESDVGVAGGYRLGRGGAALPPLMLDEEETVALAVCVRAAAGDSVAGIADAAGRALSKLEQSLTGPLRTRIEALATSTVRLAATGEEVDGSILLTVTSACRECQQLAVTYVSGSGNESERRLEPHRVVNAGRRWYLVARDRASSPERSGWRTFRLDRVRAATVTGHPADVADAPDAATFVSEAITTAPYRYRARVRLDAPLAAIARRIPPTVGVLEAVDHDTTVLTTGADDLDWLALHLGALDVGFEVLEPLELRVRIAAIADRLAISSGVASAR